MLQKLLWVLICLWPAVALAQSAEVLPGQLELTVEVEETPYTPFVREMVLITIRGVYRRHITREKLVQPDFEGFSWSQLGADTWREERLNGEKVKTMTRRMALYPDRPGRLTVGAFTHKLTLTDAGDDWFEHRITSAPVTIDVQPAPATEGWWFPVKRLRISDQWSNAPDQLNPGEGVLRVIRIEALGVTPEMIPPMPELTSPSAMIFAHPPQRLAELSPAGPISYAFWRWTIRPSNDTSGIVEPLSLTYFNTETRNEQTVTISPQRVAYGDAVPVTARGEDVAPRAASARLPGWPLALLGAVVLAAGTAVALAGRRVTGLRALQRFAPFDPLTRRLWHSARHGDVAGFRRAAVALIARDSATPVRSDVLVAFDRAVFARDGRPPPLREFARRFLKGAQD